MVISNSVSSNTHHAITATRTVVVAARIWKHALEAASINNSMVVLKLERERGTRTQLCHISRDLGRGY